MVELPRGDASTCEGREGLSRTPLLPACHPPVLPQEILLLSAPGMAVKLS